MAEVEVEETTLSEDFEDASSPNVTSSNSFLFYVFKWAIAIGVLVASIILRGFVTKFVTSIISGFVGQGDEKKRTEEISKVLSGPLSFITILFGLVVGRYLVDLPDDLEEHFDNIVKSLLDVLVFWIIYGAITPVSQIIHQTSTGSVSEEVRKVLVDMAKGLVFILGFLSILQFWGINVAAFLASLGLIGVAVGLAAQDTMKNLFASITMFADKSFTKGDWIKTPDVEGIVEEVSLRTTAVRQFDCSLVIINNSSLANSALTNFNKCNERRIVWTLGIAGDASAEQLIKVVEDVRKYLRSHPGVSQTSSLIVSLDSFGENCINLFTYFFLKETRWREFMEEKELILLHFAKIVEDAGTAFGVPTRYVMLKDQTHHK
jgi:MscS family membrane protein